MRVPNPANLLAVTGLALLGVSFYVPFGSAKRVARIESRAAQVTHLLLAVGVEAEPFDPDSRPDAERLLTRLRELCEASGQPDSDLPELLVDGDALLFGSRHYLFRLLRSPAPVRPPADWDPAARRPLEAYGWPRNVLPPGRTAFYVPEVGRPAYSRNLDFLHVGRNRPPAPGSAAPRQPLEELVHETAYRTRSDERWLFHAGG